MTVSASALRDLDECALDVFERELRRRRVEHALLELRGAAELAQRNVYIKSVVNSLMRIGDMAPSRLSRNTWENPQQLGPTLL